MLQTLPVRALMLLGPVLAPAAPLLAVLLAAYL
jgi:hypothetical protein